MMRTYLTALALVIAAATPARADDKKDEPKSADLPVKATLVAKTATYKLDLGGKSAEEFRKLLKEGEKTGQLPAAPKVELVLQLKNTSDKDVQIWVTGDPVMVNLDLAGKGAVSVMGRRAFTTDFRLPTAMNLEAGKTHEIPITSLNYGFRGGSQQAYWTEPGEYTLTASFQTGISPAPKGTKDNGQGFGMCSIKSEPVKITVEAPK
jgi:hypothetical protein